MDAAQENPGAQNSGVEKKKPGRKPLKDSSEAQQITRLNASIARKPEAMITEIRLTQAGKLLNPLGENTQAKHVRTLSGRFADVAETAVSKDPRKEIYQRLFAVHSPTSAALKLALLAPVRERFMELLVDVRDDYRRPGISETLVEAQVWGIQRPDYLRTLSFMQELESLGYRGQVSPDDAGRAITTIDGVNELAKRLHAVTTLLYSWSPREIWKATSADVTPAFRAGAEYVDAIKTVQVEGREYRLIPQRLEGFASTLAAILWNEQKVGGDTANQHASALQTQDVVRRVAQAALVNELVTGKDLGDAKKQIMAALNPAHTRYKQSIDVVVSTLGEGDKQPQTEFLRELLTAARERLPLLDTVRRGLDAIRESYNTQDLRDLLALEYALRSPVEAPRLRQDRDGAVEADKVLEDALNGFREATNLSFVWKLGGQTSTFKYSSRDEKRFKLEREATPQNIERLFELSTILAGVPRTTLVQLLSDTDAGSSASPIAVRGAGPGTASTQSRNLAT